MAVDYAKWLKEEYWKETELITLVLGYDPDSNEPVTQEERRKIGTQKRRITRLLEKPEVFISGYRFPFPVHGGTCYRPSLTLQYLKDNGLSLPVSLEKIAGVSSVGLLIGLQYLRPRKRD